MSRLVRVVCLFAALSLLAGCTFSVGSVVTGSGRTTTKDYDLSGFTRLEIGSAFEAQVTQGDSYAVSVTVDDNLVQYLDVRVSGSTLHIGFKPMSGIGMRNTTLKTRITMPDVEGLDLSGATRTQVSGFKNEKNVTVQVSGASQLHGDISTGQMGLNASGASNVEISGSTGPLDVEASGASTVKLGNFTSTDTTVRASGASNVTVNATGKLTGEASGASSVRYTGNPTSVQVNTSGASSVKQQ